MAEVCRLCLKMLGDAYYSIDENDEVRSRSKIMMLMPELELDVVTEPVLCSLCYGKLHAAYEFKCTCLASEQRITEYLKNDKRPPINLCELLEETDSKSAITTSLLLENFEANTTVLDVVKEENILKPEPLEVLCDFESVYHGTNVSSVDAEKDEAGKSSGTPVKDGFKCSNCSSEFTVLKEYRKHLAQCARYECDMCNKKFKLETRFLKHKASHNADMQSDSDQEKCSNPKPEQDENREAVIEQCVSPKSEDKSNQSIIKGGVKCSNCSTEFTVWKLYRKHLEKCAPYECDICSKKFMLEGRFLRHKLSHKLSREKAKSDDMQINCGIKCSKCHNKFMLKKDYKRHLKQCAPFECKICNRKFMLEGRFIQHKLTHSTDEEENVNDMTHKEVAVNPERNEDKDTTEKIIETATKPGIKCSKCRIKFMLKKDYTRHIRHCAPYQCDVCNKKFMLENRLRKHKLSHSTTSEKTFLCEVCSKTFRKAYPFKQHLLLHTGRKPFKCPMCERMFPTKHHLRAHKETHLNKQREKRHVCEVCGKKFMTLLILRKHRITHSKEKKFFCEICGRGFNIKMYLQQHLKKHTGEKPYACDKCNWCFPSKSRLAEHYRSHTGERPYKCNMCDKSFAQSSTLRVHVRCTHTNEKPFSCEVCGKRFTLKGNLRAHSILHNENAEKFPCTYCDKSFYVNKDLKRHVQRHIGKPTHLCSVCGKGFFTPDELKKHMRSHTGEKPFECEVCHQRYTQRYTLHVHMKVHSKSS